MVLERPLVSSPSAWNRWIRPGSFENQAFVPCLARLKVGGSSFYRVDTGFEGAYWHEEIPFSGLFIAVRMASLVDVKLLEIMLEHFVDNRWSFELVVV